MRVIAALLCIVSQSLTVEANVEKTIFLGPGAVTLPDVRPSLDDLRLQSLSSLAPILPTQLSVQFPTSAEPHGLESWHLLSGLEESRRSLAIAPSDLRQSPTDFWLDTYSVAEVFDTPELVSSLASYSGRTHAASETASLGAFSGEQSILFLRVQAAASYYSTNRTLMDHPPPVDVDIILDPFLLDILPRSLAPVAVYITFVAVAAWFLSGYIYRWLLSEAEESPSKAHTD